MNDEVRDDAECRAQAAPQRIADRQDEIANFQSVRIPEAERRKTTGRNPEHSEIVAFRRRQNSRTEAAAVGQRDADDFGVFDHMVAGNDQTEIGIHNDSRSDHAEFLRQRPVRKSAAGIDRLPIVGGALSR